MLKSACLVIVLGLLATASAAQTVEQPVTEGPLSMTDQWVDPDLGQAIMEGAATGTSLWLRGASGKLVHFDLRTGERSVAAEGVLDILPDGHRLWALIEASPNQGIVRDVRAVEGADRTVYADGQLVALFQTPEGPGVLATERVLVPTGERWSRRLIAGQLERYGNVSPLIEGDLFVGYNKGEWGGGLRRLETSTGTVSIVQGSGARPCDTRLHPDCAPVVGVIADRQTPGCVLAGTSLAHLGLRRGEVVRVCGDQVSPVFSDPLPVVEGSLEFSPGQTWPFDGLVVTDDGWVATGQSRYARSRSGVVTMHEAPPLKLWSGLRLSEPVDGVIFVQAACCWGGENHVLRRLIAVPVSD